jgi:hypothetical protein
MMKISLPVCLGTLLSLSAICFSQTAAQDNPQSSPASLPPSQQTTQPPTSPRPEVKGPDALPESPSEVKKKGTKSKEELEMERREQSQKMLGVIPQYSVTSRHDAPALTPREKFRLMARGTINPFEFVATGLQAGISQATDEFPGYGEGATGYSKRYGAALADQTSSQFFSNYFYPVLFKEDPRYFRLGEGTVKHRILYSLEQEFVVVNDNRTRGFNFSNVLGAITSGALSNAYYPAEERTWGDTLNRSSIALVYGSAGGLVDEFWPDIQKKWAEHRKKKKDAKHQQ